MHLKFIFIFAGIAYVSCVPTSYEEYLATQEPTSAINGNNVCTYGYLIMLLTSLLQQGVIPLTPPTTTASVPISTTTSSPNMGNAPCDADPPCSFTSTTPPEQVTTPCESDISTPSTMNPLTQPSTAPPLSSTPYPLTTSTTTVSPMISTTEPCLPENPPITVSTTTQSPVVTPQIPDGETIPCFCSSKYNKNNKFVPIFLSGNSVSIPQYLADLFEPYATTNPAGTNTNQSSGDGKPSTTVNQGNGSTDAGNPSIPNSGGDGSTDVDPASDRISNSASNGLVNLNAPNIFASVLSNVS